MAWVLPLASVLAAMVIHHLRGAANAPIIFISQADYPGPEALIFTVGLTCSGVWQGWTVWSMTKHEPSPWSLERMVGLMAAVCVVAMANRSMYNHLDAHILAATGIFLFGWIWLWLVQRRSRRLGASAGTSQRRMALWCVAVGFVMQFVGVAVALNVDPAVTLPTEGAGHAWWSVAALAEYLLVAGLWWGIATMEQDIGVFSQHSVSTSEP
jgi:hypothetical protein